MIVLHDYFKILWSVMSVEVIIKRVCVYMYICTPWSSLSL